MLKFYLGKVVDVSIHLQCILNQYQMKKIVLISFAALSLTVTSCNNEEKKTEEVSMDQAVEQMTQALDSANVVATDTASATTAH